MTIPLGDILVHAIDLFFQVLQLLIFIRIIMSWLAPRAGGQLAASIYGITEPILGAFRRLPLQISGIDLSPIVALLALDFAHGIIIQLLLRILG